MARKDDIQYQSQLESKEAIIFFIELSESLLSPPSHSPLREILLTINSLIKELAISIPNTGLGCYLFNSKTTSDKCEDGLCQLFKLAPINSEVMKLLLDLVDDPALETKFAASDDKKADPLTSLLLQVKKEFIFNERNNKRFSNKRVFLITDNDKPYDTSSEDAARLKKTIRLLLGDLNDFKISIVPFFLDKPDRKFDTSFYADLLFLKSDNDDDEENFAAPISSFAIKDIHSRIETTKEVRRVQFGCPLQITSDLVIEVKGFSFFSKNEVRKSVYVYRGAEVPKKVFTSSSYMTKDLSKAVTDKQKEVVRAFLFGGKIIHFTKEQLESLRRFDKESSSEKSGLKIIGFQDLTKAIDYEKSMGICPFVYVNTKGGYTNTFRVFSALFQSCRDLGRAALVWGNVRIHTYPSLYALIPSEYKGLKLSKESFYPQPQGFFLVKIPFTDNVRQFPLFVSESTVPESAVANASELLKKFTLKNGYDPELFVNSSLQWHYKTLREQALKLEVPDYLSKEMKDMTDGELEEYIKFDASTERLVELHQTINSVKTEDSSVDISLIIQRFKSSLKEDGSIGRYEIAKKRKIT